MGSIAQNRDLHLASDMDLEGSEVTGVVALAERLLRRLTTPKGMFPWWPNEGYDARDALLSKQPLWRIKTAIEAECERDEQCLSAVATIVMSTDGKTMTIKIAALTEEGDFIFTMGITEAAGTLIAVQKAS